MGWAEHGGANESVGEARSVEGLFDGKDGFRSEHRILFWRHM